MTLPVPTSGGPYAWVVPCDTSGNPVPGMPVSVIADASEYIDDKSSGTNILLQATLSGSSGKKTFIQKVVITVGVGTLPGSGELTISGVNNGNWLYEVAATAANGYSFEIDFGEHGREASSVGGDITVSLSALGVTTGKASITVHGRRL